MQGDEVLRKGSSQGPRGGGDPNGGRGGAGARGGGRGGPAFGEDQYYLAFLGTPSATAPWMLQFGGHHLAINLTLAGSQATMAPSLPAAQPATFTIEGRTVRPLGNENDKAFALINALTAEQRSQAILNSRVADLVLGPGQDGKTIQPEGIRASALSTANQTLLWELVREWVGIMIRDRFRDLIRIDEVGRLSSRAVGHVDHRDAGLVEQLLERQRVAPVLLNLGGVRLDALQPERRDPFDRPLDVVLAAPEGTGAAEQNVRVDRVQRPMGDCSPHVGRAGYARDRGHPAPREGLRHG